MKLYNKKSAIVWSTYQMYRKDTVNRMKEHFNLAQKHDVFFAFKVTKKKLQNQV